MHMRHAGMVLLVAGIAVVGTFGAPAWADDQGDQGRTLTATLKGFEESPAISSTGHGTFRVPSTRWRATPRTPSGSPSASSPGHPDRRPTRARRKFRRRLSLLRAEPSPHASCACLLSALWSDGIWAVVRLIL